MGRHLTINYVHPGIPTTIKTKGVNITTIVYLSVFLIIQTGSTIILMVVGIPLCTFYVASPTNQTLGFNGKRANRANLYPTYPRSSDKAYASPSTWTSGSGGMTSLVPSVKNSSGRVFLVGQKKMDSGKKKTEIHHLEVGSCKVLLFIHLKPLKTTIRLPN